ncbi:UNVERIFIED_CONTAM: hypothetical protein RMT77_009696 [Armadillidium vulgare]
MPHMYSNTEYVDIVYIQGLCDRNASAALCAYAVRYTTRWLPHRSLFTRTYQQLCDTETANGFYAVLSHRQRTHDILRYFDSNPSSIVRRATAELDAPRSAI